MPYRKWAGAVALVCALSTVAFSTLAQTIPLRDPNGVPISYVVGRIGGTGATCTIGLDANCQFPGSVFGQVDSTTGNLKVLQCDVHGTCNDFSLPVLVQRYGVLGGAFASYTLSNASQAQVFLTANNARQHYIIKNSDQTNTGEVIRINCMGNTPTLTGTEAGSITLSPGDVFAPAVPTLSQCMWIAATANHQIEGYGQ